MRPAKRSSGPTRRGKLRPASSASEPNSARHVLERLALEQAGEQEVALLPQRQLVVEVDVGAAGQQTAGLELDERGGDEQELGGDVEVELLHALDLGEVGVDDPGQADLVDVDLLGEDQLQQQVERALVGPVGQLGGDIDRHRRATLLATPAAPMAIIRVFGAVRVSAARPARCKHSSGTKHSRR